MDEREGSAANPPRGDNVNPNPGDGASGPGEVGYEGGTQVGDIGGEASIDLEEKARRMAAGDDSSDPATGDDASPLQPNPDEVTPNPEVQSGG